MKKAILLYIFMLAFLRGFAQTPSNDDCAGAILINDAQDFCSSLAQYTNANASPSFNGAGQDVWFRFVARNYELKVTVKGDGMSVPKITLYGDCNTPIVGSSFTDGKTTIFNNAGLIPGNYYYITVSSTGANGTFQLCLENYQSQIKPGQDFPGATLICTTESVIHAINISGSGTNQNEAVGTCLDVEPGKTNSESNSAWYRWTAANNGTLVFTITPTNRDDIDWVLYELGPEGNTQSPSAANFQRCAAGHGIDNSKCPNEPEYTLTGLDFNETETSEASGCGSQQNGFVSAITMKQGYVYALLVNNAYNGNNGFEIAFTDRSGKPGTGLFKGPSGKIMLTVTKPCTLQPSYSFTPDAKDYDAIKWYFGEGADLTEGNTEGPYTVTYRTPGLKTVVMELKNNLGCSVVETKDFIVGIKPDPPTISGLQQRYCVGETIVLNTPAQADATYAWTGPDGFTSDQREISILVNGSAKAGTYSLSITIFGCTSDPSSVTIPPIGQTPTASFTSAGSNLCTPQQTYRFTNQSTNFQNLRWNFGDGASVPPGLSGQAYSVTYATSGTKSITLEAIGSNGCITTFTQQIEVTIRPDLPVIASNKPDFCLSDTIRLNTQIQAGVTYQWTGPNNFSSTEREVEIPVTSTLVAGTYSLVLTRGTCSISPVSVVIPPIFKNPVAAFRADPSAPVKLSYPITVRFFNESTDGDSYLWDFGDSTTSTDVNPVHTYTRRGNFNVTLTVFKSTVCNASVVKGSYLISEAGAIFIPNTFTPNNDAVNDEFVVNMNNIRSYRIQIFNRYGILMYSSQNLVENWNGTYKNEQVPVGTYYYVLDAFDFDNNVIKKSGSVTILR